MILKHPKLFYIINIYSTLVCFFYSYGQEISTKQYAFKTLTINYDNPLYKDSVTYKGAGDRDLTINLKYE